VKKHRVTSPRCWVVRCSCKVCDSKDGGDYYLDRRGGAYATRRDAHEFATFAEAEAARYAHPGSLAVYRRGKPSKAAP